MFVIYYYVMIVKVLTTVNMLCMLWNFITLIAVKIDLNQCLLLWLFNVSNLLMAVERTCPEIKNRNARILMYSLICVGHLFGLFVLIGVPCAADIVLCFLFNVLNCILSTGFFIATEIHQR